MQGQGIEGKFGGLEEKAENSKIVIVPAPFDQTTTYGHGSEKGPAAIIEASRNVELYDIETDFEVYQVGIKTADPVHARTSKELQERLYQTVQDFLKEGKFVVTLGGEHAISAAPIKAHAEAFGPISVLQLDAHSDLIEAYGGNPYSHASVMARVSEMDGIEQIVSVGIRSMSSEELPMLSKTKTFFAHNLHEGNGWMEEAISALSDTVYITFDLDVFDSSLMPATGTPEPGGLFWHQVIPFLKLVAKKKNIVGFDVVELAPISQMPAPDFLAAKLVYKLLSFVFNPLEVKREELCRFTNS